MHATLSCLNVKEGSIVWTTANTFAATANAALYCGATVDFVDIDQNSLNISLEALEKKLVASRLKGCLPDVVIPVHFAGNPACPVKLRQLSKDYNFLIVEDASHAFGSKFHYSMIGKCDYSDACIFSFHAVKPVTAGEGGAVTTNNDFLSKRLKLFRSHGITREKDIQKNNDHFSKHSWFYQQITLGFNYRMSDLHAALGSSQITRATEFCNKRNKLAKLYQEQLFDEKIMFQQITSNAISAYHLMTLQFENEKVRDRVNEYLIKNKVGTNLHYIPVYRHPYYQSLKFADTFLENTERYYRTALSVPLHTKLEERDVIFIANLIKEKLIDD